MQHSRRGAWTPAQRAPATGARPRTSEGASPHGQGHGEDERGGAWQRISKGKRKRTRGSFLLRGGSVVRRRTGAGVARQAPADGTFPVYVRGFRSDLTCSAREEQSLPHIPVFQRGRFQFRANRLLGADFRIDCGTVWTGWRSSGKRAT